MKIIYNIFIPFPGYVAMMLFGVIFARKKHKPLGSLVINHEEIHRAQAADFVPEGKEFKSWRNFWAYCRFYVKYLGYWIKYGYKNVPFEREARIYAPWPEYLEHRSRHAYKAFE